MDWSNYENELDKKYSDNMFDDYLDNNILCGNLIIENDIKNQDYEIKEEEFILENKNQILKNAELNKVELIYENIYTNTSNSEMFDFSDSKISHVNSKTKFSLEKNLTKSEKSIFQNFIIFHF